MNREQLLSDLTRAFYDASRHKRNKPYRRYVNNPTLHRIKKKLPLVEHETSPKHIQARLNSWLGIMGHYSSTHLQRKLFLPMCTPWQYGCFVEKRSKLKYVLKEA